MSDFETCPICKQMKLCSQVFLDGAKNYINYACKDCHRKELTALYGKETSESIAKFFSKLEKNNILS